MRLVNSITRSHAFMFTSSSVLCRTIQFIRPANILQSGGQAFNEACNKSGRSEGSVPEGRGPIRSGAGNMYVSEH